MRTLLTLSLGLVLAAAPAFAQGAGGSSTGAIGKALKDALNKNMTAGPGAIQESFFDNLKGGLCDKLGDKQGDKLYSKFQRQNLSKGDVSKLMEYAVTDRGASLAESSEDFRFASAVASFGMLLRHSAHAGGWTLEAVAELAAESIGDDPDGYRMQFLDLVRRAAELRGE